MNYIVSGLERSGTSLMMQILDKGGFPIAYDESRKPDDNNPRGYFELHGGKIINYMENINFDMYIDKAIKITSTGLSILPEDGRKYKIIYMNRDIKEILQSTKKFIASKGKVDDILEDILIKLNRITIHTMDERDDIDYIIISHRQLMESPEFEIKRLSEYLDCDISKGISIIDSNLWRNREIHENI